MEVFLLIYACASDMAVAMEAIVTTSPRKVILGTHVFRLKKNIKKNTKKILKFNLKEYDLYTLALEGGPCAGDRMLLAPVEQISPKLGVFLCRHFCKLACSLWPHGGNHVGLGSRRF
jgi:hypothetical protein